MGCAEHLEHVDVIFGAWSMIGCVCKDPSSVFDVCLECPPHREFTGITQVVSRPLLCEEQSLLLH